MSHFEKVLFILSLVENTIWPGKNRDEVQHKNTKGRVKKKKGYPRCQSCRTAALGRNDNKQEIHTCILMGVYGADVFEGIDWENMLVKKE